MKQIFASLLLSIVLIGCSPQGMGPSYETGTSPSSSTSSRTSRSPDPSIDPAINRSGHTLPQSDLRGSQMAFLQSIREADPQHNTIELFQTAFAMGLVSAMIAFLVVANEIEHIAAIALGIRQTPFQ